LQPDPTFWKGLGGSEGVEPVSSQEACCLDFNGGLAALGKKDEIWPKGVRYKTGKEVEGHARVDEAYSLQNVSDKRVLSGGQGGKKPVKRFGKADPF